MQNAYSNCPAGKNITEHFEVQLTQLDLNPTAQEDKKQLMRLLNDYLNFPDDELANHHRNANKLGILDVTPDQREKMCDSQQFTQEFPKDIRDSKMLKVRSNACQCCGFIVQEHNIKVCETQLQNVIKLGTATRIFFQTFYNLALLLIVMTVIYSVFAFASNISIAKSSNYLNSSNSTLDYLSISLGAKTQRDNAINHDGEKYYWISSWLGVLMLVFWWFMLGSFKRKITSIENDDKRWRGVSDYSILIQNMPIDFAPQQLQKQFNLYLQRLREQNNDIVLDHIKIEKYNEGKPFYLNENQFADDELANLLKSQKEAKEKVARYVEEYMSKQQFETKPEERKSTYSELQNLSKQRKKKCQQILEKIKQKMNSQEAGKTVVFVTFLTHQMRQFVLEHNQNTIFHKLKRLLQCWKTTNYFSVQKDGNFYDNIKIQQPPQPEDIIWGNLGVPSTQIFLRKSFTILTTILMIGICFVITYGLSTIQNANKNARFISLLISLAISVTNLLIIKVIQFMTVIQKEYSMSNFQISIAIKSVVAQLINSIFVPVMTNYYIKNQAIFGSSGLVQDIFILGITNALVPPIVRLIDPYNIFLILRYKYYNDENKKLRLSQFQLNEISQKMEFQIGMEYIYLVSNFLFICFFVSLQPIIGLFGIIGLFLMYWIQKYSLFYRCQRPVPGPDVITSAIYQLIYFGPICFALGNLTWSCFLPDQSFRGSILQNFICAGLGFAMFICPYDFCASKLHDKQNKNYREQRIYFPSEYDRLNPSTSRAAIQEYRIFLNQKRKEFQDPSQGEQFLRQLANVTQRNIYKGNIFNKLIQSNQSLLVQQIFKNQSQNVVSPSFVLAALLDKNISESQILKKNANLERTENANPRGILSFLKEQGQPTSSKGLMEQQNLGIQRSSTHDYFNNYGSNINFGGMFNFFQTLPAQQINNRRSSKPL